MATVPKREESEGTLQYDGLRRAYDAAFREWTVQTNRLGSLAAPDKGCARSKAHRKHSGSFCAALVALLMSSPQPSTTESHVREAAYFICPNAGRPSQTAMSDWISAGRQFKLLPMATRRH